MHNNKTYEELKGISRQLGCVKIDIRKIKSKMNILKPKFTEVLHEFYNVRISLRSFNREVVKNIVTEMMKQCP